MKIFIKNNSLPIDVTSESAGCSNTVELAPVPFSSMQKPALRN